MQKISTISHHQNEASSTPLVSDLVFDAQLGEWVIPHQPPAVAPSPPKTDLVPRAATAGKNIVVGLASIAGYGSLIVLESIGTFFVTVGELFQILWLSSRRPTTKAHERAESPRRVEKTSVEVIVKIKA